MLVDITTATMNNHICNMYIKCLLLKKKIIVILLQCLQLNFIASKASH